MALAFALAGGLASAGHAQDYQFLGYYDYKPPGEKCSSRAYETKPVNSLAEFRVMEKQFRAAHPDPVNTICFLLKPDEAAIVYEHKLKRVGWDCIVTTVSHVEANSVEQAQKVLEQRVAMDPKYFVTSPKVVFTWTGSPSSKSVYQEDYDGVRIKFTTGKTSSGTVVVAQCRNTNPTQSMLVELQAGDKSRRFALRPGESFQCSLGRVDSFDVLAQKIALPPPTEKSGADYVFDRLKTLIRQHITVPEGQFRPEKKFAADLRG